MGSAGTVIWTHVCSRRISYFNILWSKNMGSVATITRKLKN